LRQELPLLPRQGLLIRYGDGTQYGLSGVRLPEGEDLFLLPQRVGGLCGLLTNGYTGMSPRKETDPDETDHSPQSSSVVREVAAILHRALN
jgi:hypothetical protein